MTVLPARCVVIWNGEVRTTTTYPGEAAAAGTANVRVLPWWLNFVLGLAGVAMAEPGLASVSADAAPFGARVTAPMATMGTVANIASQSGRLRVMRSEEHTS